MLLVLMAILASLTPTHAQQCLAKHYLPNLIRDSKSIVIKEQTAKLKFSYPMFLFDGIPQFALTVNRIEWKQVRNLDYLLSYSFQTNSLVIEYSQPNFKADGVIRTIGVSIWVSSRSDLIFGTLSFSNIKSSAIQTKKIPITLKKANSKLADINSFVSLLGLNVTTSIDSLEFKSSAEMLEAQADGGSQGFSLLVKVSAGQNTVINAISITYILFSKERSSLTFSQSSTLSTQLKHNIPNEPISSILFLKEPLEMYPLEYALVGISGMKLTGISKLFLNFQLISENMDFVSVRSSDSVDRLQLSYLVLGNDMMMACLECSGSYLYAKNSNEPPTCVNKQECPLLPVSQSDGLSYACKRCSNQLNMELEPTSQKPSCRCKQGFSLGFQNICTKIQQTNALADQECEDGLAQRNLSTGTCECVEGFTKDFFGFCSGNCTMANSYWDYGKKVCECFLGYALQSGQCLTEKSSCGQNEVTFDGRCICDEKSVNKTGRCVVCNQGTYKNQLDQTCSNCPAQCSQCMSNDICTSCVRGFTQSNEKCVGVCGDGVRVKGESCDDANVKKGDGCDSGCQVETGFVCNGNGNSADVCKNIQAIVPNATLVSNVPVCKFSMLASPIYLNGGIVLQLSVSPAKKMTQDEVNKLFKVSVNKEEAYPKSIFSSQNPSKPTFFRCYLDYNNQLPVIDFEVRMQMWFDECQTDKWLRLDYFVAGMKVSNSLSIFSSEDELL